MSGRPRLLQLVRGDQPLIRRGIGAMKQGVSVRPTHCLCLTIERHLLPLPGVCTGACMAGWPQCRVQSCPIFAHAESSSCLRGGVQGHGKDTDPADATAKMERDHEREIARAISRRVCVADLLEFRRCSEQLAELHSWLQV